MHHAVTELVETPETVLYFISITESEIAPKMLTALQQSDHVAKVQVFGCVKPHISESVFLSATDDVVWSVMIQVFGFVNIFSDCVRYL
ncbi:hypothetical protein C471_07596 [Halorubrum saccharovorum DSM 1137]|uniref:Uncharacterized protein n=1 Tax=Halorubrum saccharovorum DSM 1137 TaxID=1227484 RepID=M0E2R7_9EURY|nr:hypothetical protein C471_07596 [Halorubrum saccharovorum DSM 1137]